jgi:hypothetical protein
VWESNIGRGAISGIRIVPFPRLLLPPVSLKELAGGREFKKVHVFFPDLKTRKKVHSRRLLAMALAGERSPARAGLGACEQGTPAVSRAIGLSGCNGLAP